MPHTPVKLEKDGGKGIAHAYDHNVRRNGRWTVPCGCLILNAGQAPADLCLVTGELGVIYCRLHAAAPRMRDTLEALTVRLELEIKERPTEQFACRAIVPMARALLRELEG